MKKKEEGKEIIENLLELLYNSETHELALVMAEGLPEVKKGSFRVFARRT